MIPFLDVGLTYLALRPQIDEAIDRVLTGGNYISGEEVEHFEEEWANYCGANFAVGVSNGLDAIFLSLIAIGVGDGDEVIVPANTYIGTWLAISRTGAQIIPVEPDEKSYNIDPNRILQAITKKTKAILPVHLYGQAADLDPILEIANRFQLFVIEDAAQAHGAKYKGKLIGSHGHCSAWSFYPTKNLGAFGDAGAITTNDKKIAETLRLYRNYGSRSRNKHEVIGYNSRLDPVQAAILRVKLLHLDDWNSRRKEIANTYLSKIQNDIITLPHFHKDQEHAWHIFAIRLKEREKLQQFLAKNGVDTLSHYPIPPFKQKAYENLTVSSRHYSITSKISNEILSLPIGPHLETSDQEHIVDVLNSFY